MSESPASPSGAIDPTERTARFFEEVLPLVVLMRPELFERSPGSLAVFVDGVGDWTVNYGDSTSPDAISFSVAQGNAASAGTDHSRLPAEGVAGTYVARG